MTKKLKNQSKCWQEKYLLPLKPCKAGYDWACNVSSIGSLYGQRQNFTTPLSAWKAVECYSDITWLLKKSSANIRTFTLCWFDVVSRFFPEWRSLSAQTNTMLGMAVETLIRYSGNLTDLSDVKRIYEPFQEWFVTLNYRNIQHPNNLEMFSRDLNNLLEYFFEDSQEKVYFSIMLMRDGFEENRKWTANKFRAFFPVQWLI